MANLPISQLPEMLGTGLTANAEFAVAQSGTTSESSIVGTGVGSLSVPANGFTVGDSFSCTIFGHISSKNNDTLTIKIKSGSVVLGQLGAITMSQSTNQHFQIQLYFTIRAIGGATTASIMSSGFFSYIKDASNAFEGDNFSNLNNTTFYTTSNNALDITAQWSSTDSQNSIYSEILILNKVY